MAVASAVPAGTDAVGRRITAGLIDALLIGALFIAIGLISGSSYSHGGSVGVSLHGVSALVFFVLTIAYYLIFEALWQATAGKALLGLAVVTVDGGRPKAGSILVRTIMRLVDVLPFLYVLGLVLVLATGRRHQRLGDIAAGTYVVRRSAPGPADADVGERTGAAGDRIA